MRKALPIYIAFLLLSCLPLRAQDDLSRFEKDAGALSTLFRGRLQKNTTFRYNGTFYLDTRTFRKGDVLYNGKYYTDVLLNLNASTQELVIRPEANSAGVILYRDQVAWFSIGNRRFVNLRYIGLKDAPEGYYEVIRDGREPILRMSFKHLRAATGLLSAKTLDDMDENYDPAVVSYYDREEKYYLLHPDGILQKIGAGNARRRLKKSYDESGSPFAEEAFAWAPESDKTEGTLPKNRFDSRTSQLLPAGYFDENKEKEDTTASHEALTVTFRNKIYEIGEAGRSRSSKAKVTGIVYEAETGLPLPGTVVFDDKTHTYARTDRNGRYTITLPVGDNILNFNADTKEDLPLKINLLSEGTLDVVMTERINYLEGAVISASSIEQHSSSAIGVEKVSIKTLTKIPTAFGEGDVLKAVLTLPGVKTVGEASGGFNVRGGSADQNLVLFDDNTIYNPSHLFGIFSAFNPDIVENVELYKSSIPAEYGGRISSVLSVNTRRGDPTKFKGSLGIGLLTSRIHLEGPIAKGKTSFIAAARTSYSDWLMKMLPKSSAYAGGGATFSDVNLGLTHRFDDRNSLQLNGYFATDRFAFSGDTTFRYTNLNASVAFRHKGREGGSFKLSAGYDHYFNILGAHQWETGAYDMETVIRQGFLKAGWERPIGSHTLSFGANLVGYALDPGIMDPYGEMSQVKHARLERELGIEPSVYLSERWTPNEHFSVDGGIRLSSFLALNPTQFYAEPEFRFSAKYSPARLFSLKAGVNTMTQYIHLISNTSSISPMDTWRLSSKDIVPTKGWQAAAGAYWTWVGAKMDLSVEGYYNQSRNGLDYKSGALLSMNPNLADELVPVRGKAYGVEFMINKPAGRLTGWVSYTYSRSLLQEMSDRGVQTINHGDWYNAPYDKPHEFKFAGNYALTHRFSLSLNVDYSTGRPITIPVGKYYYGGQWRLAYSERNSHRIPDYFRIDAAVNIDPGHYLKALAHASVTIGVYNITGRKNPYSVFYKTEKNGRVNGYMLSVFATQVPYINLNILF